MLPINLDLRDYLAKASEEGLKQKAENTAMRTACSQQSLANDLVARSIPSNPNAGQIVQAPASK